MAKMRGFLQVFLALELCSLLIIYTFAEPFELPKEDRFKEGKTALEEFELKANNERNSECWKDAIANLKTGCKKMTDVEQSYLAVDFTNCHLKKSGRKTYNCSRDKSIEDCTGNMEDLAFNTYTQFFTHTTNICFYLQSHAWQEMTENTISKLSSTTEQVADQIENSLNNQILMLKHQNTSLENQKQIIDRERQLSTTLKSSTVEARGAFDEMKTQATQQKAIFTETFEGIFKSVENIKQLQSMLLGEFITLQSLAFHFVAVCVCYFFTSSPRTTGARLPLFIGLIILMGIERLVTAWGIKDDSNSTEVVHYRLWVCRKLFILASTIILMVTAYRYQDYNKINFNLLQQIQHQIQDLKVLQAQDKSMKAITNGDTIPMTTSSFSQSRNSQLSSQSTLSVTCTTDRVDSGIEEEDVDVTFVPENNDTDTDSSDYESIYSESAYDLSMDSFMQAPRLSSSRNSLNLSSSKVSSTPRRSRARATPRASLSPSHTYNLRTRRTPQSTPLTSSFIDSVPSPVTLEELVKNLDETTARYKAKLKKGKAKHRSSGAGLFSSDEDN